MSSENVAVNPTRNNISRIRASLNPRRYVWIIIGYYLFATFLKTSAGKENLSYVNTVIGHGVEKIVADFPALSDTPESSTIEVTTEHTEHHEGIKIFKVDWPYIEDVAVITLWILCASIAKIAFHVTPKLGHIFPESCLLIVVGIIIGVFIYTTNAVDTHSLPIHTFFFFMLPPIIFDAGYFMPSRLFFGNLGTILLFAVIGTLWNAFTIGLSLWGLGLVDLFGVEISLLELLLFSTLISAVDPVAVLAVFEEIHVNDILYIVVFGESLLNDAVTIVLYHMFEEYSVMGEDNVTVTEMVKGAASFPVVALGGTIIGILWGFMSGYVTKFTHHAMVIEPVFVFVMAYMSYLNAELFHMSGVLAITFCGITMKKYVEANISPNSSITVKYALRMLSSSSETIIFMFLGVSTVNDDHVWNWWFVFATIVFCTVYRFLGVLWMTALANRFRLNKLNMVDQFVMSYGGLRGAVSFSLVLLIPKEAVESDHTKQMFVTTTIAVVFFTVFIQGITIKPFVEWLNVKRAEERELNMNERLHERLMDHTLSIVEIILGTTGQNILRDKVKLLDETYIRPYLIRDYKGTSQAKILETYSKLEMQDAMDGMKKRRTVVVTVPSDKDGNETEIQMEVEVPVVEAKIDMEAVSRKKSSTRDSPKDILSDDVFIPVRKQRKISYSRQMLEPADLETEMIAKEWIPQDRRPRRRFGAYENPTFTMQDESGRDGGNSGPPSRRISYQDTPVSLTPASPKLSRPPTGRQRRNTPAVQNQDGTVTSGHRMSPASSFDHPPLRSPPPFEPTIEEEPSD